MRWILGFLVACCLFGGCKFEWSLGDLTFQEDGEMDVVKDESPFEDVDLDAGIDVGTDEGLFEVELPDVGTDDSPSEVDIPDIKPDETVVNPCDEDEYPDPILQKCLKYPCCDMNGYWLFDLTDTTTEPWKIYLYSIKIVQDKAYLEMEVLEYVSPENMDIPYLLVGTLEDGLLHLEGGGVAAGGYLVLDAKKVEEALFNQGEILGNYQFVKTGDPMQSGFWHLIQN